MSASQRVRLRPLRMADEARFLEATLRSRALHRGWASPPRTPGGFRELVAQSRRSSCERRLVVGAASREFLGVVSLNEIVRGGFHSAYLGYYAFAPHAGKGLMREALERFVAHAFGPSLRLHRVEANIQPENASSLALVRRLGFRREGYSPRYLKIGGRWRDHERWAVLREEWRGAVG